MSTFMPDSPEEVRHTLHACFARVDENPEIERNKNSKNAAYQCAMPECQNCPVWHRRFCPVYGGYCHGRENGSLSDQYLVGFFTLLGTYNLQQWSPCCTLSSYSSAKDSWLSLDPCYARASATSDERRLSSSAKEPLKYSKLSVVNSWCLSSLRLIIYNLDTSYTFGNCAGVRKSHKYMTRAVLISSIRSCAPFDINWIRSWTGNIRIAYWRWMDWTSWQQTMSQASIKPWRHGNQS